MAVTVIAEKSRSAVRPTLSMVRITKHFDAVAALRDVSFDVLPGEVHALLGENGAGKSTLMNVASGTMAPDEGTIVFDGATVENLTPGAGPGAGDRDRPSASGAAPGHDGCREHPGRRRPRAPAASRSATYAKAMRSLLDDVHFDSHLEDRVSSLSVARRHLLELAKAFAVSPKLLILDEPTAPLSQDSVERLFNAVRKLASEGTAVVYITHRLGEVREIADRVTVLRDGANRGTSAVKDISDGDLLALIIGRALEATFPPKHTTEADEDALLRVEGLSGHGFDDISLTAGKGEIVGLAGVVGNGQPAVLRALAGRARGDRNGRDRRQALLPPCAAQERGLHAGRPIDRGPDGRPERAREHCAHGARSAHDRSLRPPAAARSTPSSTSFPSSRSGRRRSRLRSRRSPAATSRRS